MEINLYLNVVPSLQFPYNLSINNNSHCKNLHFWKLKVISIRNFTKPFPVFSEILYHRDLKAISLTIKSAQMHTTVKMCLLW